MPMACTEKSIEIHAPCISRCVPLFYIGLCFHILSNLDSHRILGPGEKSFKAILILPFAEPTNHVVRERSIRLHLNHTDI